MVLFGPEMRRKSAMSIAPWAPKANVFARHPGFVSEAAEARSAQLPVCVLI